MEAGSETSSFFRRDAELRTVEERFRDSHLRKEPLVPVESKFREVFHDDCMSRSRTSLLASLQLTLPKVTLAAAKNFDGNFSEILLSARPAGSKYKMPQNGNPSLSDHGHLKVPSTDHSLIKARSTSKSPRASTLCQGRSHSRGFSSSKDGDDTAAMWGRAIRAESGARSHRRSTSSQHIIPHSMQEEPSDHGQLPQGPRPSEDGRSGRYDSRVHSPTCHELPTQEDEEVFRKSLMRSNTILEGWARQIQIQESEVEKNNRMPSSPSRPPAKTSSIPPASWSRFPSHNREDRNSAAGVPDNVTPKDFAVKNVSAAGDVSWTTDMDENGGPSHRNIVRSFSDKFTHSIKSRWLKIVPGRPTTPSSDKSMRGKRRSSIQTSGYLEYPELELLPTAGGYSELRALEKEINEMKGLSGSRTQPSSNELHTTANRQSLTEKMTGVLQHDGSSDAELSTASDTASFVEGQASIMRICSPETPATQIAYPDPAITKGSSTSSGNRYLTPLTHLSSCPSNPSRPATPLNNNLPRPFASRTRECVTSEASEASVPQRTPDWLISRPESRNCQSSTTMKRRSAPTPVISALI